VQVLEPPKTESFSNQEGHFIKTFLISTKPNSAGWQISKETGHQMVQSFIGKPFVIIPEHLSSQRQKGHVFASSRDELLKAYQNHTHGIIESISSPYFYGDGTDDYFYTSNIKLSDSKAAAALMEHGSKTFTKFAVSPHIWGDESGQWEGIALALVPQGAYGPDAIVTKYCKGETDACTRSLAANVLCEKEDASLAASISSLFSSDENKTIMSQVTVHEVSNAPKQEELKQEVQKEEPQQGKFISNEELEIILKEREENKQNKKQLAQLITESKTSKLNNIFSSVKDEELKKSLTEKYFNADVNQLNDFYLDVTKHVFPSLVEESKAKSEEELKNKLVEENKSKSKAASLPKEPQVPKEESKAASEIVHKTQNEVKRFERLMREGY